MNPYPLVGLNRLMALGHRLSPVSCPRRQKDAVALCACRATNGLPAVCSISERSQGRETHSRSAKSDCKRIATRHRALARFWHRSGKSLGRKKGTTIRLWRRGHNLRQSPQCLGQPIDPQRELGANRLQPMAFFRNFSFWKQRHVWPIAAFTGRGR